MKTPTMVTLVPAPTLGTCADEVDHRSYIFRQPNPNAYGSHQLNRKAEPGHVYQCGICGRWIVRGMGRWWE